MSIDVTLTDNSDAVRQATDQQLRAALEAIGLQAVSRAKLNLERDPRRIDKGQLRNSIVHQVKADEKAVYVGTNKEYAPYIEYGTGVYRDENPESGEKTWWVYVKGSSGGTNASGKRYTYKEAARIVAIMQSKGLDAHMTQGMRPNHFLRDAINDHIDEYKGLAEQYLKGETT